MEWSGSVSEEETFDWALKEKGPPQKELREELGQQREEQEQRPRGREKACVSEEQKGGQCALEDGDPNTPSRRALKPR